MTISDIRFGDFSPVCSRSALPLCTMIKYLGDTSTPITGIIPKCYTRTVCYSNTLLFQTGSTCVQLVMLVILSIIISNVKKRYTAVARKEMVFFFSSYAIFVLNSLIVDTGLVPPGSTSYGYFTASQIATGGVCCMGLAFAGLSNFNLWNDGSFQALLSLVILSIFQFVSFFLIAGFTFFKEWGGGTTIGPSYTTELYVFYFAIQGIFVLIYLVSQLITSFITLRINWWAIGALLFVVLFFVSSQMFLYVFNQPVCVGLNHYSDGLLFCNLCNLFGIMMVYKYWDIITFDDDEYIMYTEHVQGIGSVEQAKRLLI
ncbi:hypothetical protein CANARDRAFT_151334 [[Candida] arabinofermentans NRRL YB-2248]|uniref:Chitin synthase export chaperone n=1 Tax=[Candida] arabinofermentans NRRL YB-2248 TaxID=983967 RepID=A0A1E4T102_9ASCO|nr:hypothetical protein CANARDRAFT_151334 [[Candida] arabinofermentans NRRL YB-2248]